MYKSKLTLLTMSLMLLASACGGADANELPSTAREVAEVSETTTSTTEVVEDESTTTAAPTTAEPTTTAAPTTVQNSVTVGEPLTLSGTGAATIPLEQGLPFSTMNYSATDGLSIIFLDESLMQVDFVSAAFSGPTQGIEIVRADTTTAAFVEVSASGDWVIEFAPSGYYSQQAEDAGLVRSTTASAVLSADGYQYGETGDVLTGRGGVILDQLSVDETTIWNIEVPGCSEPVETSVFSADGAVLFSANQFLLADEHQGVVQQLVPGGGVAEVIMSCEWTIPVP